jgi:hypothetical protein
MQQLTITLIVLLGMIVPVANSRMARLFMRIVPPMTMTGRRASRKAAQYSRTPCPGSASRNANSCATG